MTRYTRSLDHVEQEAKALGKNQVRALVKFKST